MKIVYVGNKKTKAFEISIGKIIKFEKGKPVELPESYARYLINVSKDFKEATNYSADKRKRIRKAKANDTKANKSNDSGSGRGNTGNVIDAEKQNISGDNE